MLPDIPLAAWEPTKLTLHLWLQIVGKVKLRATPKRNHWWHAALQPGVRGLTTGRMRLNDTAFAIDLDFLVHELRVRAADGRTESFPLEDGLSVAAFDARLHGLLRSLGLDVEILEEPFGVPMTTPFPEDAEHASYDREYVERFWRALDFSAARLDEFASRFRGKQSPTHVFWHSFDLAQTRVSGRSVTPPPDADGVTQEAYSAELISFGFWAGDERTPEPSYYSYAAPEPARLTEHPLASLGAAWMSLPTGSLARLPYDAVRTAPDPAAALLEFLQSAYEACTGAAGWDRSELDV